MTFVFDLDDTLCDSDGYSEKYIKNFIKANGLPYKFVSKVARFAERKFDWDRDVALDWYKHYGDQMMLEFPCKKYVKSTLKALKYAGNRIVIATARATDWHTDPEGITKQWLERNNIDYDKLYIGRIDKEFICEEENADVFVDDDISTTGKVAQHLHGLPNKHIYLSTTLYNQSLDVAQGVKRLNDFRDLLTIEK